MERERVTYLSYITVAENLPSIIERGILSNYSAAGIPHESVALLDVQERREGKVLPSGRPLHAYANLYFWARNAMMYRRRDVASLCVIRVSAAVIDLYGVYYSTRNAAADCEFHECRGRFDHLDPARIYVRSWPDLDVMQRMQAEILVPDRVPPEFLECVYVRSEGQREAVAAQATPLDVRIYEGLFFL